MTEGSVSSIRIQYLTKENYDTWKIQVEALLIKQDTWNYVSGDKPEPEIKEGDTASEQRHKNWKRKDLKAMSDLFLSITPSILKQVKHCVTSRQLWEKLEFIYASKGPARKATLFRQIILQRMGEDVRDHMNRFFDAVDELGDMGVDINPD